MWGSHEHTGASPHNLLSHRNPRANLAGVKAEAKVAATEPKIEEESNVLCLLSSSGAPGPKAPAPRRTQNETRKEKNRKRR